jgi:hypothetical protein
LKSGNKQNVYFNVFKSFLTKDYKIYVAGTLIETRWETYSGIFYMSTYPYPDFMFGANPNAETITIYVND